MTRIVGPGPYRPACGCVPVRKPDCTGIGDFTPSTQSQMGGEVTTRIRPGNTNFSIGHCHEIIASRWRYSFTAALQPVAASIILNKRPGPALQQDGVVREQVCERATLGEIDRCPLCGRSTTAHRSPLPQWSHATAD
jgi:hypothetical protein